jgi:hypothetical protein
MFSRCSRRQWINGIIGGLLGCGMAKAPTALAAPAARPVQRTLQKTNRTKITLVRNPFELRTTIIYDGSGRTLSIQDFRTPKYNLYATDQQSNSWCRKS